jgi:ABC-2 type transport system permease protein
MEAFVEKEYLEDGVIRVVEKEDNVMLYLSRELLFGKLYTTLSYMVYEHFVADDLLKDEDISEEQLRNNFQKTDNTESLFLFSYLDGEAADVDLSYMLYPIRGLLALVVVLCGMAMGLYFMQDEERGIFTWMPLNRTVWGSWLYLFPGLLDIGVAVLLALTFSGVFISLPMELGLMGLYLLMVTGFVDVLRRLVGKPVRLGAMIPLLVLVMLAVCPIFMGEPNIKWVQLLLPPYYYLNALHNVTYQWGMGIYVIVIGFIDFVLLKIQQRRTLGG